MQPQMAMGQMPGQQPYQMMPGAQGHPASNFQYGQRANMNNDSDSDSDSDDSDDSEEEKPKKHAGQPGQMAGQAPPNPTNITQLWKAKQNPN